MFLRDSKVWPELVGFNHRNMLISVTIAGFGVWKDYIYQFAGYLKGSLWKQYLVHPLTAVANWLYPCFQGLNPSLSWFKRRSWGLDFNLRYTSCSHFLWWNTWVSQITVSFHGRNWKFYLLGFHHHGKIGEIIGVLLVKIHHFLLRNKTPLLLLKSCYPLVNVHIAMENHHAINGKIHYKWPCSIAMLVHQRVNHQFCSLNQICCCLKKNRLAVFAASIADGLRQVQQAREEHVEAASTTIEP